MTLDPATAVDATERWGTPLYQTDLDVAAMEHGYARPALKDFTTRR